MADTAIAITAGSGTNVDTRTEATNGNHRQVVVLGDPATNAGVAPVDATNGLSVTLTTAIPAGSAAIGKLAANSGVDIGDVDVTSVIPGTGATNLGKAEDAAHTSGDVGIQILGVRTDTAASSAGTDGDYAPIQIDSVGNARVIAACYGKTVDVTLTRPSDTNAYAAGDQISDSTTVPTILTFANCGRYNGGSVIIENCMIVNSVAAATPASLELWLFDTTATPNNDNDAFAPTDGVANTNVAIIPFGINYAGTVNRVFSSGDIKRFVTCAAGTTSLFGMLVVRNAYTPTSAEEFKIRLKITQL
jgi:hypothetical protein